MNRAQAAMLGRETLQIIEARELWVAGQRHDLSAAIAHSVSATVAYPPGDLAVRRASPAVPTSFEVRNETTIAAARRLAATGSAPVALNFASAKNPGGGFLGGARAQEESLARSSALYACLKDAPMYDFHRWRRDPMYTDYCLYSPGVPVFRDDSGALVEPFSCAFVTCPAVNARVVLARDPDRAGEVRAQMAARVRKVLAVAAAHEHQHLVLGAWGCGVFGNDPVVIAELFATAFAGDFAGIFRRILFAIVDWSSDHRFIGPFERAFPSSAAEG